MAYIEYASATDYPKVIIGPSKAYYTFTALTGGTSGCLDYINGNNLNVGDVAFVLLNGTVHMYSVAASGSTNAPFIIQAATNPGTKRWIRQGYYTNIIYQDLANNISSASSPYAEQAIITKTVPETGLYWIEGTVATASTGASLVSTITIKTGSSTYSNATYQHRTQNSMPSALTYSIHKVMCVVSLSANDSVHIGYGATFSGTMYIYGSPGHTNMTFLSIVRIG